MFTSSVEQIKEADLVGFFVGWPDPPTPATHLNLLKRSDVVVLARDEQHGKVVGFITAITDQTLAAYIPFLEVLPEYQHKGIGTALVGRMSELLKEYYMVDLLCDPELRHFYATTGMEQATGMMRRQYRKQSGI